MNKAGSLEQNGTYRCASTKCGRHRLDSLVGRAHLTFTVWTAASRVLTPKPQR